MQLSLLKHAKGPSLSSGTSSRTRSPQNVQMRHLVHSPRQNIPHDIEAGDHPLEPQKTFPMQSSVRSSCDTTRRQLYRGRAVAALAAASIVCPGIVAPLPGLAEGINIASAAGIVKNEAEPLAASLLVSTAQLLEAAEAPALVSDSSDVLVQAAKDAVANSLPDLATHSMTAVGGPIIVEPPLVSSCSSNRTDTAATEGDAASVEVLKVQDSQPAAETRLQQQQQPSSQVPVSLQPPQAASLNQGVMSSMWQAYCHALQTSPLLTKVYTGIAGTFIGDLAAQLLTYQASKHTRNSATKQQTPSSSTVSGFEFDAMRSFRLCLYSAVIGTPMGHCEYALLEKFVMPATPTAPAAVAAKVCLDQFVQTPFGMALFFAVMKVLEGKPHLVGQELQSKIAPALLANWKLWPAAQLVNFMLIPTEQRILFGNIVGICWTCIISNMQQGSSTTVDINSAAGCSKSSMPGAPDTALQVTRSDTPVPVQ